MLRFLFYYDPNTGAGRLASRNSPDLRQFERRATQNGASVPNYGTNLSRLPVLKSRERKRLHGGDCR